MFLFLTFQYTIKHIFSIVLFYYVLLVLSSMYSLRIYDELSGSFIYRHWWSLLFYPVSFFKLFIYTIVRLGECNYMHVSIIQNKTKLNQICNGINEIIKLIGQLNRIWNVRHELWNLSIISTFLKVSFAGTILCGYGIYFTPWCNNEI